LQVRSVILFSIPYLKVHYYVSSHA
jgi:hypothetical protein